MIVELYESNTTTSTEIIREYGIDSSTLYKWVQLYGKIQKTDSEVTNLNFRKIGIDVGASHISTGLIDEKGNIKFHNQILINNEKNEDNFIEILKKCIDDIITKNNKITSIGIAFPGNCCNNILLSAENIGLENINIKEVLKKYNVNVNIENDAVCALLGELNFGSLKNYSKALMLTFGTGIGYAFYDTINNKIVIASDKLRDELNEFNMSNKIKARGAYALQRLYSISKRKNVGRYEIFEDIKEGDKIAIKVLNEYINNNCIGIKRMCMKLNINTVCVGGGLSEYSKFYIDKMREQLLGINVLVSKYRNDAGMVGATLLPIKEKGLENLVCFK